MSREKAPFCMVSKLAPFSISLMCFDVLVTSAEATTSTDDESTVTDEPSSAVSSTILWRVGRWIIPTAVLFLPSVTCVPSWPTVGLNLHSADLLGDLQLVSLYPFIDCEA